MIRPIMKGESSVEERYTTSSSQHYNNVVVKFMFLRTSYLNFMKII